MKKQSPREAAFCSKYNYFYHKRSCFATNRGKNGLESLGFIHWSQNNKIVVDIPVR